MGVKSQSSYCSLWFVFKLKCTIGSRFGRVLHGHLRRGHWLAGLRDVIHGVRRGLGAVRRVPAHWRGYRHLRWRTAVQIRHAQVPGNQ